MNHPSLLPCFVQLQVTKSFLNVFTPRPLASSLCCSDFLNKTFAHPVSEGSSANKPLIFHMGKNSLADFVVDFPTLALRLRHWPPSGRSTYLKLFTQHVRAGDQKNGEIHRGIIGRRNDLPIFLPCRCWLIFVAKQDETLRPCIDFWRFNEITIKNNHSLSLIKSAFKPLQEETFFTELDTYHLD